uniref:Ribonuclease H-like domain-containing protein n=1 Tax=Tanacetum cinerariifolium TaxID=118510 RepID=A0A6L2L5H2_TANCI|nr:ribonuclease H-like domain-containing protein [Tanacetum cinerariifolium]
MLDEHFKPPPNIDHPFPEVPTLVPVASTSLPSSTSVDQDAPSTSTLQTTLEQQSSVIPQGVEDDFYDIEVAHIDNDPYFGIPIPGPIMKKQLYKRMLLAILLDRFRHEVNYKNMPFGANLTQMTIRFHSVGNGLVEICYLKDYIKMEMKIPRSSRVKFIATCSYSRLNDFITSRKNDPKLLQSLISTSSSVYDLVAYSDADWVGCPTTRRSTSGAEVEYRGVANAIAETCWLRNLLRELHTPLSSATLVYCDNVRVLHVPSRYLFADIFIKGLPSTLFEEFRSSLSVRSPLAPTAKES